MMMLGQRQMHDSYGFISLDDLKPGEYGKTVSTAMPDRHIPGGWHVRLPDGQLLQLDPKKYKVVEHDNGSITVTPTIETPAHTRWNLTAGLWMQA